MNYTINEVTQFMNNAIQMACHELNVKCEIDLDNIIKRSILLGNAKPLPDIMDKSVSCENETRVDTDIVLVVVDETIGANVPTMQIPQTEKQDKLAVKEAEKQAKLAVKEAEKQAKLAVKEAEKQAK